MVFEFFIRSSPWWLLDVTSCFTSLVAGWTMLDHHVTVQSQGMSCSYNPQMGNYKDWWSTPMTPLTHCSCGWDAHFSCWTIPLLLEFAFLLLTHPFWWYVFFSFLRVNPNFTYSNFSIQVVWTCLNNTHFSCSKYQTIQNAERPRFMGTCHHHFMGCFHGGTPSSHP